MVKKIKVPWAAWREPDYLDITFPDSWQVSISKINNAPELNSEDIKLGVNTPIGTSTLSDLVKGKKNVVIVVDDMTRITPTSKIIPHVLETLHDNGVKNESITILVGIGGHRPLTRDDFILKLGKKVVDTINIENHHPYINLTYAGESKIGTPIHINSTYYNADLKISIGGVITHPQYGFGGGAKLVLPGLSSMETITANHLSPTKLGISEGVNFISDLRKNAEDIADIVGLDYSINVVLTELGCIAGVYSGHFIDAHRKAIEFGKKVYATKIPQFENDICFFNTFPADLGLNQASRNWLIFSLTSRRLVNSSGHLVLMCACSEGRGYHTLYVETGGRLYGDPKTREVPKQRMFFYSQNISESDLYHYYTKNWELYNKWDNLIAELDKLHENPKVLIVNTSIQIPEQK